MRSGDTVSYKGKRYTLLWEGKTRYGRRAKLQFLNGQKEFWVDSDRVEPVRGGRGGERGRRERGRTVMFRYWSGHTVRMSEEDAAIAEDMGQGYTS